jgi:hypothetical protein
MQEQGDAVSSEMATQFPVDVGEGRSLPNVLKRISNLLALKSTVSVQNEEMCTCCNSSSSFSLLYLAVPKTIGSVR